MVRWRGWKELREGDVAGLLDWDWEQSVSGERGYGELADTLVDANLLEPGACPSTLALQQTTHQLEVQPLPTLPPQPPQPVTADHHAIFQRLNDLSSLFRQLQQPPPPLHHQQQQHQAPQDWCYYHQRFGNLAWNCRPPCGWTPPGAHTRPTLTYRNQGNE
ncbi:hypothetical protein Pcinc_025073 [Petrolisthes cinctipes]|uniref:Uncharacterized protein n=1 Tax=Petrolisthes cinctipes TaxID=88211 RepID=A0AAE1FAR5_PETCI|nr:hypothetical protein Pcinc_025073 [Petrolisthes cinctipes]